MEVTMTLIDAVVNGCMYSGWLVDILIELMTIRVCE